MICGKTYLEGGSCHNIGFAYSLHPVMLKHLEKFLRSHYEMWACIILGQIWPKLPIFSKREFLVNLNVTFIYLLHPHYASWRFTNINRVDHDICCCINLGNLIQITYLLHKEYFWGKMTVTFCWSFVFCRST